MSMIWLPSSVSLTIQHLAVSTPSQYSNIKSHVFLHVCVCVCVNVNVHQTFIRPDFHELQNRTINVTWFHNDTVVKQDRGFVSFIDGIHSSYQSVSLCVLEHDSSVIDLVGQQYLRVNSHDQNIEIVSLLAT